MFDAWELRSEAADVRRLTGATVAAAVVMALVITGLLFMAARPAAATTKQKVDVSFRPPPPPPEPVKLDRPPPPPPPKPKPPVPKAVASAPAPMVAPRELPKEKAPEADEAHAVEAKELAVGGTGLGLGSSESGTGGDGDESAAPVVASAGARGPVNLPEDADPPEPDEDNEQPEYPESARASGLEARVVLKIVVEATGTVGRIDVLRGEEPFTAEAIAKVRTWTYEPAKLDGVAIAVFKIVDLRFRLRSE